MLLGLRYDDTSIDRLYHEVTGMEESVTYQAIINKGQLKGAKNLLLAQGIERFGPPGETVYTEIQALNSLDEVKRVGCRLMKANGWQELLSEPVT